MCRFFHLSWFPLRCFPWVWSLCPMTTGSTRWRRGCGMEWASFPLQPPPCCGRRGSCQRPRAAATAHHQTGARGSSHLVPYAGVCVHACVRVWGDQGLGTCITLFVFVLSVEQSYVTLLMFYWEGKCGSGADTSVGWVHAPGWLCRFWCLKLPIQGRS